MYSEAVLVSLFLAVAEAAFGREQIPVADIAALGNFGGPGVAATLAGGVPGSLLAGANACDKLILADQIVDQLGNDPQVIAAAIGLVSAEKNFNPFVVSIPDLCADPALPVSIELRGVLTLVDVAVLGSDLNNQNVAASIQNPLDATGLSVAELTIQQGFANFTAVNSDGTQVDLAGLGEEAAGGAEEVVDEAEEEVVDDANQDAAAECGAAAPPADAGADDGADVIVDNGQQGSSVDGADFGLCVPTIAFIGGLNGRPDDEFTFIPQDPLVAEGQQEALNPNIITNRVCDQLTNVCEANDAAKALCEDAQAQIEALGTRDLETANTFNELLGFAGADATVQTI